tara:strand:+ start:2889 stop:4859 length:1971 start_codon:yes stop_codon:yes gene_type:complete
MSIKEEIMKIAVSDPSYQVSIDQIKRQMANTNIVAEDLVEAIRLLEMIIEDPRKYAEIRQAAIADGLIDEGMFPPEFDKTIIISLLIVLYGLQDSLVQEGYARGGLRVAGKQLGRMGQGGDTMLAHINPREAEVLRRMGGQGTVNPNTGLQEYKGLKNIIKTALPIALSIVAPGLGTAIGTAIGLSGTAAAVAGGALLGGATSFATGGDPLLGALTGGIGGAASGVSEFLGGFANIGEPTANLLAGAGTGALTSAIRGGNIAQGAMLGAAGSMFKPQIENASKSVVNSLKSTFSPMTNAVSDFTNPITQGFSTDTTPYSGISDAVFSEQGSSLGDTFVDTNTYDFMAPNPSMASYSDNELMGGPNFESAMPGNVTDAGRLGSISNLDASINKLAARKQSYNSPQNPALGNASNNVNYPNPNDVQNALLVNDMDAVNTPPTSVLSKDDAINNMNAIEGSMPQEGPLSRLSNLISSDTAKMGGIVALLASMDGGSGDGVGMPKLTKAQEEYFNRNLATWDWSKIQAMANAKGTSVTEFITNDKFRSEANSGMFNQQPSLVQQSVASQRYARGGLSAIPGYATGSGDGRADLINARLSDGEYVIDAESVSMLGNGSNKAGAKMLNDMRKNLRSHKGKALADGRFSPDAKSPLEYMKRSA